MISTVQRIERAVVRRVPVHVARSRLRKPIASFSFDDVPVSALETGAKILESRGVAGTFYVCGSLDGARYRGLDHHTADHLRAALGQGHEIGCHAFDHIPFPKAGPARLRASVDSNAAYFKATLGDVRPASFAYPFGDVNWTIKSAAARAFPIARGVSRGINAGRLDYSELRANPLDRRWEASTDIAALIAAAKTRTGWLIFFTHDVQNDPTPEGCQPDRLARTLDAVLEAGFDVLPIKSAAARAKFG
jgi:peptidoglycan/xylan/chitin deacetylase (PgdA/CDA1 family)